MALFSFRHSVKTFSPKRTSASRLARLGQTAAHLRYISRPQAARAVLRARLDGDGDQAVAAAAEAAAEKRKGRACERFIVALPLEATSEQREALVHAFAERLTRGVAGYVAAIHDTNRNDARNPHFHLVAFDRHISGGGRGRPRAVIGMARKNAVETAAESWAEVHNTMMREWGYGASSMITHRSFADRSIDRIAQIHEGPGARHLQAEGCAPTAKEAWRNIDGGATRAEANRLIREINAMKETIHAREHRLGRVDEKDRGQREVGGAQLRTSAGGSCRGDGDPTQPFVGLGRNQREAGGSGRAAAQPPFLGSDACSRRAGPPAPFAESGGGDLPWLVRGRRRVRRVFHELTLLCGTLAARLGAEHQGYTETRAHHAVPRDHSRGEPLSSSGNASRRQEQHEEDRN